MVGRLGDAAFRFAVGAPDAARSSVWRLWTHTPQRDGRTTEIYLALRNLAGDFKASLHASGNWRIGFSRDDHPAAPPGHDRAMHKWRRPREIVPGWTRAFQIGVPAKDVVRPHHPEPRGGRQIHWFPRPAFGTGTFFDVFIAAPDVDLAEGWPGRDAMGTTLAFQTALATEEVLCLLVHEEPFDDSHVPRNQIAGDDASGVTEDIRGFAVALIDDGTWAFIDVAVDPPPSDS